MTTTIHAFLVEHYAPFPQDHQRRAVFGGIIGSCYARDVRSLNVLGLRVLPLGYFGIWVFGFALTWAQGRSILVGWILSVVLLSFVLGSAVMHFAMTEQLINRRIRNVLLAMLGLSLWLMVTKPG